MSRLRQQIATELQELAWTEAANEHCRFVPHTDLDDLMWQERTHAATKDRVVDILGEALMNGTWDDAAPVGAPRELERGLLRLLRWPRVCGVPSGAS